MGAQMLSLKNKRLRRIRRGLLPTGNPQSNSSSLVLAYSVLLDFVKNNLDLPYTRVFVYTPTLSTFQPSGD